LSTDPLFVDKVRDAVGLYMSPPENGAKLAAASEKAVAAFQADDLDPDLRAGWTVTAVGHAARITDVDQLVEVSGVWLMPWAEGRRENFIRIMPEKVTGRRLDA
jgi:Pyridoxamine 5'-phosphate oxidase